MTRLHPDEIRARRYEARAADAARRGDARGAEALTRWADRIREAAGLPDPRHQTTY